MVSTEIEKILGYGTDSMSGNGYLVCNNCKGYYQLQKGETASDFDLCECGGSISFYSNLEEVSNYQSNNKYSEYIEESSSHNDVDYEELQNTIINLRNKAEKRKEMFEELSKKVEVHEELLNDIKEGKWSLIEGIAEKKIEKDVQDQKMLLSNILTQESANIIDEKDIIDTIMAKETQLISQIRDKRSELRKSDSWNSSDVSGGRLNTRWENDYLGVKLNFMRAIVLFIVILIIMGFLYLFFVMILK